MSPRGGGSASASTRVAVDTNVFELCELKTVEWRVFEAPERDADSLRWDAFAALVQQVTQPQAPSLYAWHAADDVSDDAPENRLLWVFSINKSHKMPTIGKHKKVHSSGQWSHSDGVSLPSAVQQPLFRALRVWLSKKLLLHSEFVYQHELFRVNEAKFVYRCPSTTRANEFDVYLDEQLAVCGFQLHFHILPASQLLCVNVEMVLREAAAPRQRELDSAMSSWQRLMGLPRDDDHSVVDVWHLEDSLVARSVAETKYEDVYPRFRAVARRKAKRHSGDDGGDGANEGDAAAVGASASSSAAGGGGGKGKGDDTDEADDTVADGDADGDDARHPGKKKRKKTLADVDGNDESMQPVSPDTHVNSPEASGPVVCMTFPHDQTLALHVDHDVHIFKRQRKKRKMKETEANSNSNSGKAAGSGLLSIVVEPLTPSSYAAAPSSKGAASQAKSRSRSTSLLALKQQTEATKPQSLSLAVSLVASLTQDEKHEALDCKPVKSHPLLQALDAYVEKEMSAVVIAAGDVSSTVGRVRLVPNAPAFSPSLDERKTKQLGAHSAPGRLELMKNQLLSDRFTRCLTGYFPRDFRRHKRQQRREHERKLLLEYDDAKLRLHHEKTAAANPTVYTVRDQEITIGIHLAASEALVPWRLQGQASKRWTPYAINSRAVDARDMRVLVNHLTPHLTKLQGVVKGKMSESTSDDEAGEVRDPWLSLDRYCVRTGGLAADVAGEMRAKVLDTLPRLCVSSVESSLLVEIPAISEYTLRNFQPVAAAKSVDYAIICPVSPSQWLGTLTLSYLMMLRSVYAQSSMGDQVALDLHGLVGEAPSSVHIDAASAMLMVECASQSEDAFATFRAAGELLRPLLSQGTKKKQAFARSPMANVVYVVAPFRRSDVKHKLWLLGALGRGLFGDTLPNDGGDHEWTKSVTLELVYLEDLVEVSVETNPFALLPTAMALYNRIFEQVSLKPVDSEAQSGQKVVSSATAPKNRFVCERLYHLAEGSSSTKSDDSILFVHVGYAISTDGKWLLSSYTDATGSILETNVAPIQERDGGGLSSALLALMTSALDFVALLGEKAMLVIARLTLCSTTTPDLSSETTAWQTLSTEDTFQQLLARFEPVVAKIWVVQASFMAKEDVQVRLDVTVAGNVALCGEREGVLVVCADRAALLRERSRVANTKWLRSTQRGGGGGGSTQETALLRVRVIHGISLAGGGSQDHGDAPEMTTMTAMELETLLTEWSALSYLTVHPVTLERQSPLPLQLTAVDTLYSELEMLETQLARDPLALRR